MPVTDAEGKSIRRRGWTWLLLLLLPVAALSGLLIVPFFHPLGFQVGNTYVFATTYGELSLSLPQWKAADVPPPPKNDGPLYIENPIHYRFLTVFGKVYKVVWFRATRRG